MQSTAETLRLSWRLRRAWWFTATARTRARFARTLLGSFWLGLSNLLSIAALSLVYGVVFQVPNFREYVVYLGIGLVLWGLLASSVSSAASLFEVNSRNLLNNNIHPVFYTLEEWIFQIQTFVQSFLLVMLVLACIKPVLLLHLFGAAPLPLLNMMLFVYWLPLMVCLLGARSRDLYQLVPIVLQLIFLVSPILYRKASLGQMAWIATWNPLYVLLDGVRAALLEGSISWKRQLLLLVVNGFGIWFGLRWLERDRARLPFLF